MIGRCAHILYVTHRHTHIYRLTLKLVRGLVGDGVEDLVDFGVEIWLLEIPFTRWRKTGRWYARAVESHSVIFIMCVDKTAANDSACSKVPFFPLLGTSWYFYVIFQQWIQETLQILHKGELCGHFGPVLHISRRSSDLLMLRCWCRHVQANNVIVAATSTCVTSKQLVLQLQRFLKLLVFFVYSWRLIV